MLFLDTHSLIWLYAKDLERFTAFGLSRLENETLFISPAVSLELEYLFEIGRIRASSSEITSYLTERIELTIDPVSFLPIAERALRQKWTRDPFDRLIAAQADFHDAGLLTRDSIILKNYSRAFW